MSDTPVDPRQLPTDSAGLVDGLKSFAAEHHGATAAIEYVGRRGARIVLVGQDGAWAEQLAPATDVAREACREAGVSVENGWESELAEDLPLGFGRLAS